MEDTELKSKYITPGYVPALAGRHTYSTQITPFVLSDILIPPDLKLPVNWSGQGPPTAPAVNLGSPGGGRPSTVPQLDSIYSMKSLPRHL